MIFKKTLSVVLAALMLLSVVPVMAEEAAVQEPVYRIEPEPSGTVYDTSIFEGHATYLMEDGFGQANANVPDEKGRPSGWDIEYRGGNVVKSGNVLGIYDMSDKDPVIMSKKILPHKTGKVTFETVFKILIEAKSGFRIDLLGEGGYAARLVTQGDQLCIEQAGGKNAVIGKYTPNTEYFIKAILDMDTKKIDFYWNGKYVGQFAFSENCTSLEEVVISTPDEDLMDIQMRFVNMYINYLINETFMEYPVDVLPDEWKVEALGAGTATVANVNCGGTIDSNSFRIFDDFTIDGTRVSHSFADQKKKVQAEVKFIVEPGAENFSISLNQDKKQAIKIVGKNNNFYTTKDQLVREAYRDNFWYTLKFIADVEKQTADIYLNYKIIAEGVPFENKVTAINNFSVETGLKEKAVVVFDDVKVFEKLPRQADYVPEPKPVDSPDADLAMLMYSMWREGVHYGWDRISPYANREPYLGYYGEGSTEVADWEIKWLVEHGFDYQVYTWSRDNGNQNHPVKNTQRYNALMDGYLSADYSHMMKFALLYSYIKNETMGGSEDFRNNIVPYWIEYYFKDPRYMVVDNKPILYIYTWSKLIEVFGSVEAIKAEFDYLSEECKKIGFDGVLIVGDSSGQWKEAGADAGFTYTTGHKASSLDTMKNVIGSRLDSSELGYVPSIAMGWSNEAWITGIAGEFATPETIGELTKFTLEKFDQLEAQGRKVPRQIIYTCWNEWGEGHYFCPSTVHGFGYMQEVRNNATTAGYNTEEMIPTEKAKARMSVLYPPERKNLKILNDPNKEPDPEDVYVLKGWYFDNPDDYNEWFLYKDIEYIKNEDGKLIGHSSANDPRIANENMSIPLDNVAGIRSKLWVDGGATGMFIYRTDKESNYGSGKRFDASLTKSGYAEYFAPPTNASKTVGATMTGLFFDPDDGLYQGFGDFGLEYIEILAWKTPRVNYYLNGTLINKMSEPKSKDGITYMSGYRILQTFGVDTKWVHKTGTFTIKKNGLTIIMKDGSNIANVNGVDETMPGAAYYDDGHFMVPLQYTCDKVGITVTNEEPVVEENAKPAVPFQYEFNTPGSLEGGRITGTVFNYVKDGYVYMKATPSADGKPADPLIRFDKANIDASKYNKTVKVGIKNMTGKSKIMLYFQTSAGGSAWYKTELQLDDVKEFKEYVFNLEGIPDWKGTITTLRIDPTTNPGDVYIDYIRVE